MRDVLNLGKPYWPYMVLDGLMRALPILAFSLVAGLIWQLVTSQSANSYLWLIFLASLVIYGLYFFLFQKQHSYRWFGKVHQDFHMAYLKQAIYTRSNQGQADFISRDLKAINGIDVFYQMVIPDAIRAIFLYLLLVLLGLGQGPFYFYLIPVITLFLIRLSRTLIAKGKKKVDYRNLASAGKLSLQFMDYLEGMMTLKVYQADQHYSDKFAQQSEDSRQKVMDSLAYSLIASFTTRIIIFGMIALSVWLSLRSDKITSRMIIQLFLLIQLVLSFQKIGYYARVTRSRLPTIQAIIQKLKHTDQVQPGQINLHEPAYMIKAENLGLAFPDRSLFVDANFELELGQLHLIVGRNGSGKSSLLQVLRGIEAPNQGDLFLNDRPYTELNQADFLNKIAFLDSQPYLFSGSIADNIHMGTGNHENLDKWLKDKGLCSFVRDLELGLDTQVGQAGKWLSKGQSQQIALARQIWANKEIYLLDEVTSGIDQESSRVILKLLQLMKDQHLIMAISHKASEWIHADQILFINNSQIETNEHQDLLMKNKSYANLYRAGLEEED